VVFYLILFRSRFVALPKIVIPTVEIIPVNEAFKKLTEGEDGFYFAILFG
jgi:hypothetical protein